MADDQQGKHAGDDDDDASGNAADEPTAVWDAEALRQAGLDELGPLPEHNVPPPATPATAAASTAPSMVVDPRATGTHAKVLEPGSAGNGGNKELSWPATLGLALGLGGVVYALIRFLR